MALDAWLPIGFRLPDGAKVRIALFGGPNWQILETQGDGRALVDAVGYQTVLVAPQAPALTG